MNNFSPIILEISLTPFPQTSLMGTIFFSHEYLPASAFRPPISSHACPPKRPCRQWW